MVLAETPEQQREREHLDEHRRVLAHRKAADHEERVARAEELRAAAYDLG